MKDKPYWRLSSFYFFYYGLLGCVSPYWALYLDSQGYSALEIGELLAAFGLVRIIAPAVWGRLGDRFNRRLPILRLGALFCALIFIGIIYADNFSLLLIVMMGYGFFWAAILPQFEVITLNTYEGDTTGYSSVRVWGSIGFIFMVFGLGIAFEYLSVNTLPGFMLLMLAAILVSSFLVSEPVIRSHATHKTNILALLLKPQVIVFFVVAFLIQVSHGVYYAFFSLFLELHQYSKSTIGILWAVGVLAEIILFWQVRRFTHRFSFKSLLLACLVISTIRWWLTGYWVDSIILMLLLQFTHAITFGLMHSVSMHYVHKYFNGPSQGLGQALFSSLAYGAGGAAGALIGGQLWTTLNASLIFEFAAICSFLAAALAFVFRAK